MAEKTRIARKLAAELYHLTEEEKRLSEKRDSEPASTRNFYSTYDNFETILEKKGSGIKKEIEARMNGRKTRKYGKDVIKRTELLRKDIEGKKKSEIIREMKTYSEAVQIKAKLLKFAGILRQHALVQGLSKMKNVLAVRAKRNEQQEESIEIKTTTMPGHYKHPSIRFTPVGSFTNKTYNKDGGTDNFRKYVAAKKIQRFWKQQCFKQFMKKKNCKVSDKSLVEVELKLDGCSNNTTQNNPTGMGCIIV